VVPATPRDSPQIPATPRSVKVEVSNGSVSEGEGAGLRAPARGSRVKDPDEEYRELVDRLADPKTSPEIAAAITARLGQLQPRHN
jgi:hypothetical protein